MNDAIPPRTERQRGVGCLVLAMVLLAFLGGLGFLLAGTGAGGSGSGRIREVVRERIAGAQSRLVHIEAHGLMLSGATGVGGIQGITLDLLAMLERAADDPSVAGVLLELDTPGGSVTDADLVHRHLSRLKERGKKVVVLMGDLCASGGLYAAVAADRIYALPTTITGSIGVIISGLNVADLLSQHGVKDTSIMSGPNKALLSPTRPVEPGHQVILQGVVDAMYLRFVQLVATGRGLSEDKVRALADGRILTADAAKAGGLVDEIDYPDAALAGLRALAGGGPYDVVRYEVEPSIFELLKAGIQRPAPEAVLLSHLFAAPRAMYVLSLQGGLGSTP